MSFVYIDSQGREVNIPSVDAVRLRIELGAIKDQTRFLDQNTGKWAPAVEHEIYRTLKRQLMAAEQGFVAPPPPAAPGSSREAPSPGEVEALRDADALDEGDPGPADGAQEAGSEPVPDPPGEGAADRPPTGSDEVPPEFEGLGNLELLPMDEEEDAEETADAEDEEGEPSGEGDPAEAAPAAGEGPEDPPGEVDPPPSGDDPKDTADLEGPPAGSTGAPDESFVTSAEEELLGGLGADAGAPGVDDGGLELESSLEASYREPVTESGPATEAEEDAFGSVWDSPEDHQVPEPPPPETPEDVTPPPADAVADVPEVEPGPPPPRGAPPQRKLTRARTPGAERIAGMAALVVVVGAALFFGWRFVAPALGVGGFGEPEIVLPPLEQELVPRMRQLAGRASERMAQDMLGLPERAAIPGDPSEDWLAGIYLAGASEYPGVPAYWEAVAEWVAATRTVENALFREALQAQLDTANLAASDAEAIRDRALAGFQAAGSDRRIVYDQMQEVAERALVLHEFLLANEDQVSYEPAGSGVSRDPALEAVPATPALGDEMWELVGSITNAMDALGYLDRIETERLLAVFLEKLEATAIR